jgi:hypothetical protein
MFRFDFERSIDNNPFATANGYVEVQIGEEVDKDLNIQFFFGPITTYTPNGTPSHTEEVADGSMYMTGDLEDMAEHILQYFPNPPYPIRTILNNLLTAALNTHTA